MATAGQSTLMDQALLKTSEETLKRKIEFLFLVHFLVYLTDRLSHRRQIFDILGFEVDPETNRLNPPEFSTEQARGTLLRAWLEISAIAQDWIRRYREQRVYSLKSGEFDLLSGSPTSQGPRHPWSEVLG